MNQRSTTPGFFMGVFFISLIVLVSSLAFHFHAFTKEDSSTIEVEETKKKFRVIMSNL